MHILNKESGVLGLSGGISSDFRDIDNAADSGNKYAKDALDIFCYSVAKYIGSYAAAMNGVDAIAFTAGVGENDARTRRSICAYLGYLGAVIDDEANNVRGKDAVVSTADSKVKLLAVPTNEELAIARETVSLLK
jgi:acetate kinase